MVTARAIDRLEEELVSRGEAFFMVSGAGHEAGAFSFPPFAAKNHENRALCRNIRRPRLVLVAPRTRAAFQRLKT